MGFFSDFGKSIKNAFLGVPDNQQEQNLIYMQNQARLLAEADAKRKKQTTDEAAAGAARLAQGQQVLQNQITESRQVTETATAAAAAALKQQQDAAAQLNSASTPAGDSETAILAVERLRRRRLQSGGAFAGDAGRTYGAAPVGFRALSGA